MKARYANGTDKRFESITIYDLILADWPSNLSLSAPPANALIDAGMSNIKALAMLNLKLKSGYTF